MITVRHAAVRHRTVHALGGEADADELLRRPIAVTPEPAALAGGSQIMLARSRLPSAGAGLELAHLHHPRLVVAEAHAPVMRVGAGGRAGGRPRRDSLRSRPASAPNRVFSLCVPLITTRHYGFSAATLFAVHASSSVITS